MPRGWEWLQRVKKTPEMWVSHGMSGRHGGGPAGGRGWTQDWDGCGRPDPVNAQPAQASCEEEVAMSHSGGHWLKAGSGAGGEIGVRNGSQVWAWAAWFVEVSCCRSGGEGLASEELCLQTP